MIDFIVKLLFSPRKIHTNFLVDIFFFAFLTSLVIHFFLAYFL